MITTGHNCNWRATGFTCSIDDSTHKTFTTDSEKLFRLSQTRRITRRQNYGADLPFGVRRHVTAVKTPTYRRTPKLCGSTSFFRAETTPIHPQAHAEFQRQLRAQFLPAFPRPDRDQPVQKIRD